MSDIPVTSGDVSLGLFARNSSGLVRALSISDTVWYGIMAAGALFGLLYLFPTIPLTLPGANIPLAILIAVAVSPAVFAVYAGFASAMPRMGGDYLFQSRALHPSVGFSFTFAWEVFMWVTFCTTGGLVVATMGLAPMLYNLGLQYHASSLMTAATWIDSPNGILTATLGVTVLAFFTTLGGMFLYRTIQRYVLIPALLISTGLMIAMFARSHASFIAAFNTWNLRATGVHNAAGSVQAIAAKGGFAPAAFSLKDTILAVTVVVGLWYVMYGTQGLLGEIKRAGNFRKLWGGFLIGEAALAFIFFWPPVLLFNNAVGYNFQQALAFAGSTGHLAEPIGDNYSTFALMMTTNPVIMVLLPLGFIMTGYYFAVCVFLNMTRVLCSMGMDRSIPQSVSKVSERFHAPVNAAILFGILAVCMNLLFRVSSAIDRAIVLSGALTSAGAVAVTGLAAMFFPWRTRRLHDASPVGRYRLFGLPIMMWAGLATVIVAGGVVVLDLVVPALGFTSPGARWLLLFSLLVTLTWFFAYRAYLRRWRGIDIDLAFKEVPPE